MADYIKDVEKRLKSLPNYQISIGVFSGDKTRKEIVDEYKLGISTSGGITNAELMFIHENGSPLKHIPARPVLDLTITYANKNLVQKSIVKGATQYILTGNIKDLEDELERLCIRMESYARRVIRRSNLLAPNAPSTIKRKGSDRPLLDTGQLANSIRCKLIKK